MIDIPLFLLTLAIVGLGMGAIVWFVSTVAAAVHEELRK